MGRRGGRGGGRMGRMGGSKAAGPGGFCVWRSWGQRVAHKAGVASYQLRCPDCGTEMLREESGENEGNFQA
ncbi:MAG: ferredoxin, partial [Chloroflexi bacterium]